MEEHDELKSYSDLTYLGRVRRLREVAAAAIREYRLEPARFRLIRVAGNVLFRVLAPGSGGGNSDPRYEPDQYLLRIHEPGYQTADAIELELAWLASMSRDAGIPVPCPVPTRDGRLVKRISVAGLPGPRDCSLLRWLKGRFLTRRIGPAHYRAQGRLMARLHSHAASWRPPGGLAAKRCYDWAGLFQNDSGAGIPASDAWGLVPATHVGAFEAVSRETREIMDGWGKSPDVYGLIHGDLGIDANVLFWRGEARAIDFDDSGLGYWAYDLAVSLEHCREDPLFQAYRDALLEGYVESRTLPSGLPGRLDLLMAAFDVYWSLWAFAVAHRFPHRRAALGGRMRRAAGHVMRYTASGRRNR
jgi:Ser/Thr protein kinase RdoA (MazF antagonist)